MKPLDKDFPVLDALNRETVTTQRQLADCAGISLGQVNYVLKSLLERGLVKVTNFTKSPRKISYVYRLTPKGLEAKSALAARFVMRKIREYGDVKDGLAERLSGLEKERHFRVFFVGPPVVADLIKGVIEEKRLGLHLAGQCKEIGDLSDYDADFFDKVLVFDGNKKELKEASKSLKVPLDKLAPFW